MDESTLFLGLLFGCIGMGYFIYGKKQRRAMPLISGVYMCASPYIVTNPWILIATNIVAIVLPRYIDI